MARRLATTSAAIFLVALGASAVVAQESGPAAVPVEAEPLLAAEALDELVAPVALYPDALLTQVFVAATYPLEVVKADRWADENAALEGEARAEAADAQGWDPSVAVLAAGFPTVLARMEEDLDWTEALGDALLAQPDDVLDAVQRQRARADALGNLESNAAQTVTVEGDAISIAPANPEVVYVPAYDPSLAYSQSASAAPVIATDPADEGWSDGAMIATGVIGFGAGMIVNEIFDDDDDDWGGYWRGPPRVDWDDGNFYPRPGRPNVDIGGDVNINVDRDGVDIDRPAAWRPDPDRKKQARDRLAERDRKDGGGGEALADRREGGNAGGRDALKGKLAARSGDGGPGIGRPSGGRAMAERKSGAADSVFAKRAEGLTGAKKTKDRGAASALRAGGGDRKKIAKPKGGGERVAAKKVGPRTSALKRDRGGGGKAKAAKARGGQHAGKLKRR